MGACQMNYSQAYIAAVTRNLPEKPHTALCLARSHDLAQHKRSWRQAGYGGPERVLEEALFQGGVR